MTNQEPGIFPDAEDEQALEPVAPGAPETVVADVTATEPEPEPAAPSDPTPPDVPPTEIPPEPASAPPAEEVPAPTEAESPTEAVSSTEAESPTPADVPSPAETAELLRARFDAAAAELGILAGRIASDELLLKAANVELERIKAAAASGGPQPDALRPQLEAVEALLAEKSAAARAARAEATAAARVVKERIVEEAETLAAGDQWRAGGQRLAELLDEWKACARLDRKSDDTLWKRFSSARSTFTKRRKAHYATLTAERDTVKSAKQSLVEQAEALAESTAWAATSAKFRDLMTEWKTAGRAGKDIDDELWERFRTAQDTFFNARKNAAPAPPRRESAGPRGPRPERSRPAAPAAPPQPRTNPAAVTRARETVDTLRSLIEGFEAKAAKANAAGDTKAATAAKESADARREWLAEAERTLAELS
ncbi:MAG: DUF349 domain-containing protein [Sporichthyaceae bacterium]